LELFLKCFFGAQKGVFNAKYQPLLWAIFHDIYKLAWPDLIFMKIQKAYYSRHLELVSALFGTAHYRRYVKKIDNYLKYKKNMLYI